MSLQRSYFDDLYEHSADPWSLAERWYERRKYAVTMASLPRERYARAFEPGCSVGVLTALLAARCDELLATDIAESAVAMTRRRVAAYPGVTVERRAVPEQWPEGSFDLVVLSELGYYLDGAALAELIDRSVESLRPGGTLIAVHWRHPVADYPQTGDHVQSVIRAEGRLTPMVSHVEPDFALDVLARPPAVSPASAEGLA